MKFFASIPNASVILSAIRLSLSFSLSLSLSVCVCVCVCVFAFVSCSVLVHTCVNARACASWGIIVITMTQSDVTKAGDSNYVMVKLMSQLLTATSPKEASPQPQPHS